MDFLTQSAKSYLVNLMHPFMSETEKIKSRELEKRFFNQNALIILGSSVNLICLSFFFPELRKFSAKKKIFIGLATFGLLYNFGISKIRKEKRKFDEDILAKYKRELMMTIEENKIKNNNQ